MKKLLFLLCFVSTFGFAQGDKDNLIYVAGSASVPTGDFADGSGGAATSGFSGDFFYQHKRASRKTQGFMLGFRYMSAGVDKAKVASASGLSVNSVSPWTAATIFYGVNWQLEMAENVYFEPRILIGIMFANTPSVDTGSGTVPSVSGTAFATQFGFKFRFDVSDNVSLLLGTDYTSGNPKFTYSGSGQSVSANQLISTLNFNGGIGYRF